MKKLLIATDCFLPRWDGVARFLAELIPRISHKYKITVLAPEFKGKMIKIKDVEIETIPVFNFSVNDFNLARPDFKKVKRLVNESDIVFSQTLGTIGTLSLHYASKMEKPIISYIHSIEWELVSKSIHHMKKLVSIITKAFAKHMYNKSDMLLVPSEDTGKLLSYNGIHTKKKVVHLGVETERFSPPKDKRAAKKKLKIDPDKIVIGFTGRIGREKNLITLYRAFRKLQNKHDNIILLIVGKGMKEESFPSMKDIIHVGSSNTIQDYLKAMDIFVMPSLTETSSLSTMEAMSCGLPVVSTNVGFIKFYIKNRKNGYLFPKKNMYVLTKKLERLIENEELRSAIGLMARKTMTSKFYWDKTVKGICSVLDKA